MAVLVIYESLQILNLNFFPSFFVALNDRIESVLFVIVLREEPLDHLVVKEVWLLHAEDFERLFLGYKSSADSKAFYRYFPAAIPFKIFGLSREFFSPEV